ncbi:MAG: lactoylglutathione lyase [Sphingomonas sp.]|nr:lactoylglutathione lyase [Sphingomonas sp.]
MERQIFINLPVTNVVASSAFYAALGAEPDERFCDASSAMMRFTDTITVMLLEQARFTGFTSKPIADARTHSQALFCLSCADRAGVDRLANIARWAGGRADPMPSQDYGFLYGRSFEDPDGHGWEAVWMDVDAAMAARQQTQDA